MAVYFSYIGDLDDPAFCWDNPADATARHGNLPRRLVPVDRYQSIGVGVLWMMEQIASGAREGKQLDWGAWGLRMTAGELVEFFGSDHEYAAAFAVLDAGRDYVLVAGEGA